MSFVDEVYSMYQGQIGDHEEDAITIALNVLDNQTRDNVMQLISQMNDNEVIQMMGIYLIEMLKVKMLQDGKLSQMEMAANSTLMH